MCVPKNVARHTPFLLLVNCHIHLHSLFDTKNALLNMEKITLKQKQIMIEFISSHRNAFSANCKNRFQKEMKWNDLTDTLNKNGPPTKQVEKWKQVSLWCKILRILVINISQYLLNDFCIGLARYKKSCKQEKSKNKRLSKSNGRWTTNQRKTVGFRGIDS